jgi:3-deoxy-D-manno-octulosonate 8-phosphate phosphatase (KDO 8-P phosphatase)
MEFAACYQQIEMILSDVDGVLTDGLIHLDSQGNEAKTFNARDGLAIKSWQEAGFQFGIITARSSTVVQRRAAELGIRIVQQGCEAKLPAARSIANEHGWRLDQVCYIGDDLPDLPVIQEVGLGVAVADAAPEVRRAADLVMQRSGGAGAVRELVEILLKAKNHWDTLVQGFAERK